MRATDTSMDVRDRAGHALMLIDPHAPANLMHEEFRKVLGLDVQVKMDRF